MLRRDWCHILAKTSDSKSLKEQILELITNLLCLKIG